MTHQGCDVLRQGRGSPGFLLVQMALGRLWEGLEHTFDGLPRARAQLTRFKRSCVASCFSCAYVHQVAAVPHRS